MSSYLSLSEVPGRVQTWNSLGVGEGGTGLAGAVPGLSSGSR